jgi:fermentation-respiration switch protein FrsA (DUF1100 family)
MKAQVSKKRSRISLYLLTLMIPTLAWAFGAIEHRGIYHPEVAEHRDEPLKALAYSDLRNIIKDVYFKTGDGVLLNAWYVPAKSHQPTIVFAHGNGGNLGDRYNVISMFIKQGYGFLAFDYRGYGKSKGYPSEQGLYRDFEAATRFLEEKQRVPVSKQIAMGGSLGSAVALDAASKKSYRAVIAYSCFTTAPDVAEHLRDTNQMGWLRYLPPRLIMRQHYDSLKKVGKIKSPIIYLQGTQDKMMPLWMAKKLYQATGAKYKKLLIIPDAGHNSSLEAGSDQLLVALKVILKQTDAQQSLANSGH